MYSIYPCICAYASDIKLGKYVYIYIYTCRLILLPWQITELELLVSVTKGMGNNIQGAIVGWVELYASNWFITSWTSSFLILQPIENPIFAPIYIYIMHFISYIYIYLQPIQTGRSGTSDWLWQRLFSGALTLGISGGLSATGQTRRKSNNSMWKIPAFLLIIFRKPLVFHI